MYQSEGIGQHTTFEKIKKGDIFYDEIAENLMVKTKTFRGKGKKQIYNAIGLNKKQRVFYKDEDDKLILFVAPKIFY